MIQKSKLLGVYSKLPRDLFRVNATAKVILHDFDTQQSKNRTSYDLNLNANGLVGPVQDHSYFHGPNGMSLRPNSPSMQQIIREFRGRNVTVYKLAEGLELDSSDLICLWEHTDHFSLQTRSEISLSKLNRKLTDLCVNHGQIMTKAEFCERYPFSSCSITN